MASAINSVVVVDFESTEDLPDGYQINGGNIANESSSIYYTASDYGGSDGVNLFDYNEQLDSSDVGTIGTESSSDFISPPLHNGNFLMGLSNKEVMDLLSTLPALYSHVSALESNQNNLSSLCAKLEDKCTTLQNDNDIQKEKLTVAIMKSVN